MRSYVGKNIQGDSPLQELDASFDEKALKLLLTPEEHAAILDHYLNSHLPGPHLPPSWVTARGIALDRPVLASFGEEGVRQVVLLGAGMDLRPWRIKWPAACSVFEIDSPSIISARDRVASQLGAPSSCKRVGVVGNLSDWPTVEASLLSAGFRPSVPTAWIAEGLLGYLSVPHMFALFHGTRELSSAHSLFVAIAENEPSQTISFPLMKQGFLPKTIVCRQEGCELLRVLRFTRRTNQPKQNKR